MSIKPGNPADSRQCGTIAEYIADYVLALAPSGTEISTLVAAITLIANQKGFTRAEINTIIDNIWQQYEDQRRAGHA